MTKVSLIIAIYNSHEIVRRQLLHLASLGLKPNRVGLPIELIIVDDGSIPPVTEATIRHDSKLAWTQGLARNLGAREAKGEYLFFTDIDHIISKQALEDALNFTGNRMLFRRQIAVLDEQGRLTQDPEVLRDWGWKGDKLDASVHGNTFVIKRESFLELGGYREQDCIKGYHPISRQGEDCHFNARWNRKYQGILPDMGRDIYMFPVGRFHKEGDLNPKGLFHNLSQDGKIKRMKGDEL